MADQMELPEVRRPRLGNAKFKPDADTSAAAEKRASHSRETQIAKVLEQAARCAHGWTQDEMEVATGILHQSMGAIHRALEDRGVIELARDERGAYIRRPTRTGCLARTYVLCK